MQTTVINYLVLLAYATLILGVFLQIRKTKKRETVGDIAIWEVVMRFVAMVLIMAKLIDLRDPWLIFGQTAFMLLYSYYLILIIKIKLQKKKVIT
ncbi:hypothetical protein MYX07_02795 [Patescibacteria group bacterium AH-259-L07]|nr:hypothetical protein [Patescibacteria group bacterium AH-259-L07]